MITTQDYRDYTQGGCYDLAVTLHRLTGWPLAVIQCDPYARWGPDRMVTYGTEIQPDHAFVVSPWGPVDIGYDRYGHELETEWDVVASAGTDESTVARLRWRPDLDADRTKSLALDVLAMVGLDHTDSGILRVVRTNREV